METNEILQFLQHDIHTVIMATNDQDHHPITCAIDLMLLENDCLYFLTAKGKSFYQRLILHKEVAFTGLKGTDTLSSISISVRGRIRNIGTTNLEKMFDRNPYMKEIYPDQRARDMLEVFEIYAYTGEYFDLRQNPIFRTSFSVGTQAQESGYVVSNACIGCHLCYASCPQRCIDTTCLPVRIQQVHCLHCGKCREVCPVHAIQYIHG